MTSIVGYITKYHPMIQLLAGTIATMLSLAVYAYTTFVTKAELHEQANHVKEFTDYRLDRLDKKLDRIDDMMQRLLEGVKK